MIISRTPFRISFVGGGTDLPSFYNSTQGAVISTTIDKYVYITVNKRFDNSIRASYSVTEIVDDVEHLKNELFREAMKETGVVSGVEITAVSDIPTGSGMGTSSAFTVGLLNALYAYKDQHRSAEALARTACRIEMETLEKKIGKQDQYAAAYGGLRKYTFNSGSVFIDPIICLPRVKKDFFNHLMLFYVGGTREASSVLKSSAVPLTGMRTLVEDFWAALCGSGDMHELGEVLRMGWHYKKQMGNITNAIIDNYYEEAMNVGALGGKLLGAGQGGFLLFLVAPRDQKAVRIALRDLRQIPFHFENEGSKIIYVGS